MIDCSNPAARRTVSRRKMQDQWRRDPRWKAMVEKYAHAPGAVCVHCGLHHGQQRVSRSCDPLIRKDGKPGLVVLTINHKTRDLYANEDLYLTWNPDKMEVCCTACNREYERGRKPCPTCSKGGYVRYIKWYDEECQDCFYAAHPEELKKAEEGRAAFTASVRQANAARAARQRQAKVRHPCTHHRIGGKCGLSAIGSRCTFSPSKALKMCGDAVAKKGVAVRG